MFLEKIGIYGWSEKDENLILTSILTGDPLLIIGNHGSAKTHLANKLAQSFNFKFLAYDASKAMFEDVLGYPNIEKLKEGCVEYIPSPVTIWDKDMVLIDELNRAIPELQSKWLEIIRSRKIMGFNTNVKWVWAAMNPSSYSGTVNLDDALVGRFSLFLYSPELHNMTEHDRIRVASHMNGDDAPSLMYWSRSDEVEYSTKNTIAVDVLKNVGTELHTLMKHAHKWFFNLKNDVDTLSEFLARFSTLLLKESNSDIIVDGRRLGFMYRNILANRSIELAKNELYGIPLNEFSKSSFNAIQASIPVGINDESLVDETVEHVMENCYNMLSSYFDKGADISIVNTVYELFTTPDLFRRVEILLTCDLSILIKCKGWSKLLEDDNRDMTLFGYTALQVEHYRPGTIPPEMLTHLSTKIDPRMLTTATCRPLSNNEIEYMDEINDLIDRTNELTILTSRYHIDNLLSNSDDITLDMISKTKENISADINRIVEILTGDKLITSNVS